TRGQQRWGTTLAPAEVAAAAIAAVRNDRRYVFTHPESRTRIEARLRPILHDLDASEKDRTNAPLSVTAGQAAISSQIEPFIAVSGDLGTLVEVGGKPNQGHEDARLTGDVRAQVPRVALRVEGVPGDLVDMAHPGLFSVHGRLDGYDLVVAQVLHA